MLLIKEGIAKNIPENLVKEYKAQGWREVKPAEKPAESKAKGKKGA